MFLPSDYAKLLRLRKDHAALRLEWKLLKLKFGLGRKYNPDQPRIPAGNSDGGQWTSSGVSDASGNNEAGSEQASIVDEIVAAAKRLNIAARPSAYQKCLDLCYRVLERFQPPGSDRNTWDFHKCMNACLARKP